MARSSKKIIYDDKIFDSKTEFEFYKILKISKAKGKIIGFECSKHYVLQEGGWLNWRGDKQSSIDHYPDYFITLNSGEQIIVDTKGGSYHETDAKLKHKIFEYLNREIPYYYVSKCPLYIGGEWVETTPNHDMKKKLELIYNKLYPNQNKRLKDKPILDLSKWNKYIEYHDIDGLFYVLDKVYTKKELEKMNKIK